MSIKVAKFGGTSLASAGQFRKVQEIVTTDAERRYVVNSAPGKRYSDDQKITDLLYLCHDRVRQGKPFDDIFTIITNRYLEIIHELGLLSISGSAWPGLREDRRRGDRRLRGQPGSFSAG